MKSIHAFAAAACLAFSLTSISAHADSDDGLTPRQRTTGSFIEHGAHNIHDPIFCSQRAIKHQFRWNLFTNEQAVDTVDNGPLIPVPALVNGIAQELNPMLDKFIALGDPLASTHAVCVGFYDSGVINAQSFSTGYILIDPRVLHMLNGMAHRSMLSIPQVYLHEFAHQIQFWSTDPFANEHTQKRTELAADCTGAALLYLTHVSQVGKAFMVKDAAGIIASAESVGDNDYTNPSHHGTSAERIQAVRAGMTFMDIYLAFNPGAKGLTLKATLEACNERVSKLFSE